MPRRNIDYSKTYFYKIVSRDTNIENMYIGHTTDFKTRKGCHKRICTNPKDKNYNLPLYKFIRDNDGWDNFDMIWLETGSFENSMEARKRERELIEEHKASLNKIRSYSTSDEQSQMAIDYYYNHKEDILNQKKERYNNNKEYYLEKNKEWKSRNKEKADNAVKNWVANNRDTVRHNHQRWRDENREKLREKQEQTTTCECGTIVQTHNLKRHERCKKHQDYINSLQDD